MVFVASVILLALLSERASGQEPRLRGNAARTRADGNNSIDETCGYVVERNCSDAENDTIGDEEMFIYRSSGTKDNTSMFVLLLHGWDLYRNDSAATMCDLARKISSWGYSVIVPRGNGNVSVVKQPLTAPHWALKNSQAVMEWIPSGSRIALVGHSLGAGAALYVSQNSFNLTRQFRAYVALHPATVEALRLGFDSIQGPVLFTISHNDTKYWFGGVTDIAVHKAFQAAHGPKAYVDVEHVKQDAHSSPITPPCYGGNELSAMKKWFECFLEPTQPQNDCPTFQNDICTHVHGEHTDCTYGSE